MTAETGKRKHSEMNMDGLCDNLLNKAVPHETMRYKHLCQEQLEYI